MITIVAPAPAKIVESLNIAAAPSAPAVSLNRFGRIARIPIFGNDWTRRGITGTVPARVRSSPAGTRLAIHTASDR